MAPAWIIGPLFYTPAPEEAWDRRDVETCSGMARSKAEGGLARGAYWVVREHARPTDNAADGRSWTGFSHPRAGDRPPGGPPPGFDQHQPDQTDQGQPRKRHKSQGEIPREPFRPTQRPGQEEPPDSPGGAAPTGHHPHLAAEAEGNQLKHRSVPHPQGQGPHKEDRHRPPGHA